MKIAHLSVSRKNVWDLCQQKYKFQYHLNIDTLKEEPYFFTYGKAIHKIAQLFIENKGEVPLSEIATDVVKKKIPIDKKNGEDIYLENIPKEYKDKFPKHLESFKKLNEKIGNEGITEFEFRYDLDPPNKKYAYGFIDRIIEKNGIYYIIDYKTSKDNNFRKRGSKLIKDLQLRTYALVLSRLNGVHPNNIRVALYYLEGSELVGAKFNEKALEETQKELLECYDAINNADPDKVWGNVGSWCKNCDFVKLCPFYKIV